MATTEDRMKILQMLQEGKLSAEAAAQLLQTVEEEPARTPTSDGATPNALWTTEPQPATGSAEASAGRKPRWLRVRVTDSDTGRPRVNVRLPLSLVNVGLKLGSQFAPEIEGLDFEELMRAVDAGETGAFVDVVDEEDGEHVEVFLE